MLFEGSSTMVSCFLHKKSDADTRMCKNIYIYIYIDEGWGARRVGCVVCVCVCVCVCVRVRVRARARVRVPLCLFAVLLCCVLLSCVTDVQIVR